MTFAAAKNSTIAVIANLMSPQHDARKCRRASISAEAGKCQGRCSTVDAIVGSSSMLKRLQDHVAVVSGAESGTGLAIARCVRP